MCAAEGVGGKRDATNAFLGSSAGLTPILASRSLPPFSMIQWQRLQGPGREGEPTDPRRATRETETDLVASVAPRALRSTLEGSDKSEYWNFCLVLKFCKRA